MKNMELFYESPHIRTHERTYTQNVHVLTSIHSTCIHIYTYAYMHSYRHTLYRTYRYVRECHPSEDDLQEITFCLIHDYQEFNGKHACMYVCIYVYIYICILCLAS